MPLSRFEECWPLPTESLPELIVFLAYCLFSGNPVYEDHASAVKKKGIIKSLLVDLLCLAFLGLGVSMLPLGTLSLGLWVIAVDPAIIT